MNDYRIVFDKDNLDVLIPQIRVETIAPQSTEFYIGQLLTHIQVGFGRYQRGETFSARLFLTIYAMTDITSLLNATTPAASPDQVDSLDPLQRLEIIYPEDARHLNEIVAQPLAQLPLQLLDYADTRFTPLIDTYPHSASRALRRYICSFA